MGKVTEHARPLRGPLPMNLHVLTTLEVLYTLSFWTFMKAPVHRHE